MSRARKRPRGAPTFVASIPLWVTSIALKQANTRYETARIFYNPCLRLAMDAATEMRADLNWKLACKLVKGPVKTKAFRDLRTKHHFSERELMSAASVFRTGWLREKVGCQEAQVLGQRAYRAVNRWLLGLGGKPRYKSKSRGLHSLECKDKNGDLKLSKDLKSLQWGRDLQMELVASVKDSCQVHALEQVKVGKLLYCRILRTKIKARWTYRVQLVLAGVPLARYQIGDQKVGLDLGPSQVNVVCNEIAVKETFCAEIEDKSQEIRRLQRKLDRQHRSGSKGCFDSKGRHTQGGCDWKMRSHRSKQTQNQLADIWRRLAAQRESLHGNLANRVLAQGAVIKTEGISYGSWQKNFGKSVNRRAPGSFISTLARKAANAGGQLIEVNPWSTKLSQTCVCGRQEKKSLSQRTHVCPICHLTTDRDILSALLVRHVDCGATHTLDLVTTQNEMQHRHDIDGWSRFSVHNLRVPQAIKLRGQGENPWSGSAISSRITVDARGEAV